MQFVQLPHPLFNLKSMSSRVAFARDLTSDRVAYAAIGE